MADKFMQHDGVESGYFSKRKAEFNKSIADGLKAVGFTGKVNNKPKHRSNTKATEKKEAGVLPAKQKTTKDLTNTPPNQLKGKDFVERMRLAREAKAKKK